MIATGGAEILILEDDPGVAALQRRHLERAGFTVHAADTPAAALQYLEGATVDLILLDYRLGEVDGLDFMRRLQELGHHEPVILVTGCGNEAVIIQALRAGVRDYVAKSLEYLDYLPLAVERVLHQVGTERELAASEARLTGLINSALDAIISVDAEQRIVLFNPAAEKMFGCSADLVLGEPLDRFIPERFRAQHGEDIRRFGETGVASRKMGPGGIIGLRADGREFPAEAAISKVEVFGQTVFTAILRDITERQRAEENLRLREEHFRSLIENSYDSIFVIDAARTILYQSPSIQRILGYEPEELVGKNPDYLIHPDDLAGVRASHAAVLQSGLGTTIECRLRHKDGSWRVVESVGKSVRDLQGRLTVVVNARDITERRLLEDQFRQAQKMEAIGTLAGGVAHDFNNLLTVINGYSELLLGKLRAGDPMRGMMEQIKKAGERAAGLTRQLLAFSRKQMLVLEVLDLNSVVGEMDKMLRRLIGEDIDLLVSLAPGLWRVLADAGQIEQVVMNLVVNARDAMPRGGKLTIETANVELDESYVAAHRYVRPGAYALLAISDTGHGMAPATRARIFEPFFTTKGPEKGTGLGLSTVYGIVKQSNGSIEVYSEPGQGTTFKIYLPRSSAVSRLPKSPSGIAKTSRGAETVLLVEDDAGVRSLSRMILEEHGYAVLEADNGGAALLRCEQHQGTIHILVTDVVMPTLSGPQLAERLLQLRPALKVLFLSGYTDEAIVHHGVISPDTPFLQKPFAPAALAQKVRAVLDAQ